MTSVPNCLWGSALIGLVILIVAGGCSQGYVGPVSDTPEGQLDLARHLVETEHYYDATVELKAFMSKNPGSALMDKALYYLGRAYLGSHDYAMASAELERLLREFPGSEYAPDARYMLGVSSFEQSLPSDLDPTMTLKAIDQLQLFIRLHPESPFVPDARSRGDLLRGRMAEKQYMNGTLYLKLKQHDAARFYFGKVLEQYADSGWAPKAMLAVAQSYEMQRDKAKALEQYGELIKAYPNSEEAAEARLRVQKSGVEVEGEDLNVAGEAVKDTSESENP